MKKTIVKYLKLLFIVLIVALLFGLESKNRAYLAYIIIFGVIGGLVLLLLPQLKALAKSTQSLFKSSSKRAVKVEPKPKSDITLALMCQFSHRITAKLKSAYPDSTWDWEKQPNVQKLLDGEKTRIRTWNTDKYTHAEMLIDNYGNIVLQMMLIESIDGAIPTAEPGEEQPVVVDCNSWFSLLGQKALTEIIGELNSHGHSSLFIDDSGMILVKEAGDELLCKAQMPHFPGKKYYEELISIFTKAELKAAVENKNIKLSWS